MATPTLTRHDQVFVLDFGDDENVTSDKWVTTVQQLLDEVDAAEGPRALVTMGSGKHYSNGLDVSFMSALSGEEISAYVDRVLALVYRLMLIDVPTVAAVNGHAFGMGAFLAITHDHAIMRADRGYVCFPEVHIGMSFPEQLLCVARASLSPPTLRQALTSGRRYSGPEAAAAGIVNSAASIDDLVTEAKAHATQLASTAGKSLGQIKRQILTDVAARLPRKK